LGEEPAYGGFVRYDVLEPANPGEGRVGRDHGVGVGGGANRGESHVERAEPVACPYSRTCARDDEKLGGSARRAIAAPSSAVFVSAVTAWEIAFKQVLGRVRAPDLTELPAEQGFRELPLTVAHALAAGALPALHGDPLR
jgi:hypothetical protein